MQNPRIYSDSYQFLISVFDRIKSSPKAHRPTLGRRIKESAMDLTVAIRVATTTRGMTPGDTREDFLRKASRKLDEIRIFTQLAYDVGALPVSAFSELSEMTGKLGKQIGAMIRFEERRR